MAATLLAGEDFVPDLLAGETGVCDRSGTPKKVRIPTAINAHRSLCNLRRHGACSEPEIRLEILHKKHSSVRTTIPLGSSGKKRSGEIPEERRTAYESGRNSYSSMTAATAIFVGGITTLNAHHAPLAAHSNTLRQRDLGWQGQRKIYGRAGLYCRIDKEADAPGADVTSLRRVLLILLTVPDSYWQTKREAPRRSLCHYPAAAFQPSMFLKRKGFRVSTFPRLAAKSLVRMSISDQPVKKQEEAELAQSQIRARRGRARLQPCRNCRLTSSGF